MANEVPTITRGSSGSFGISNNSFSGADITAMISIPGVAGDPATTKVLATLQTLTYSIFRDKQPVRSLGFIGERGRTRGPRTVAGSMVHTVFDRHVLFDILRPNINDRGGALFADDYADMAVVMIDQLPPFDIIVRFANEYGHAAELVLFGVEVAQEGQVMSIQDLITENTFQYTAQHISYMRPGGYRKTLETKTADKKLTFRSLLHSSNNEFTRRVKLSAHNPFR